MGLDNLKTPAGSRKARKRKGRGHASGNGKTAGRGHKGQRSRAGGGVRRGFEGGQMPLHRRVPKRGFHNLFRKKIAAVNVRSLNQFEAGTEVTPELLVERGLVKKIGDGVKILAYGELTTALNIKAHAFSKGAVTKIEAAGGTATTI